MLFTLFKTFFKIGAFTFGGGYAMISLVKEECVEKYKWLGEKEFLDLMAVAESTPGPIAINMATYVGYKTKKLIGAIVATLGIVLPSIIIIYIISLFFRNLLEVEVVANAFFGIRIAVSIIIIKTAYELVKNEYKASSKKVLTIFLFLLYASAIILINAFNINISSSLLIISAVVLGVLLA